MLVEVPSPDYPFLHDARFSPDGRWLIAETGSVLTVWELDAAAGTLTERGWFGMAGRRGGPPPEVEVMDYGEWLAANPSIEEWVMSRDGRRVIGAGSDGIGRWRLHPEREPIATKIDQQKREDVDVARLALSPDERTLLVLERERVAVWSVGDALTEIGTIALPDYPGGGAAFTADGRHAVVAGGDFVALIDVRAFTIADQQEIDGNMEGIVALGGDRFATGGSDRRITPWRVQGGKLERGEPLPEHHTDKIYTLAAPADGRFLAAASTDGTATLWSLVQDEPPIVIELPLDHFYALAIHPHGPYLATGGQGLRVWRYRRDAAATGRR
jgi:WD40 repeat protein